MHIFNQRAHHDFHILEKFEAGIHLTGPEVKSIKSGRMSLEGAFVKIIGSEAYLVNAKVSPYPFSRQENYDPGRIRKLLIHKNEAISLKSKIQSGNLTLVPILCYTKTGFIKVEIGLAKGKKRWDKKEEIKKKDLERELERELREKI